MTIREFVRTLREGRYLVLASVLVVVAAALVYLDRQETTYTATATVELMTATANLGTPQATEVTVATTEDDVTSEPVAVAAAAALGADDPDELASRVSVAPGSDDGLLVAISAQAPDEREAVETANAFAEAYILQLEALRDEQVGELEAQQVVLTAQLDGVKRRLLIDPTDPLALAEKDAIVARYQALVTQRNVLTSIAPPGVLETKASDAAPVGLSSALVVLIAVMAGVVAGIGLAFAWRGLDQRVRSAPEASRLTGIPVLAELNGVRGAERRARGAGTLPVASKVATPFTESIRELRTAVQVTVSTAEHVVVVVTATDPRAQRSFIAANLAASFALSGRRTIAVSGDLRRPQLEQLLPPPEDWTTGVGELRPTQVPNLSVFTAGEQEMDPADYLATTGARSILDHLRAGAEVVVVDAPPVLAAADATILGGYADGTVIIASAGQTDRAVLVEAVARLQTNNVPIVGLALAGVRGDRRMLYASTYGEAQPSRPFLTKVRPGQGRATAAAQVPGAGDAGDAGAEGGADGVSTTASTTSADGVEVRSADRGAGTADTAGGKPVAAGDTPAGTAQGSGKAPAADKARPVDKAPAADTAAGTGAARPRAPGGTGALATTAEPAVEDPADQDIPRVR